ASEDVARYIDINRLIKKLEKEKDEVKGRLISTLGDFSKGHASPGDFSYLTQSKVSVNTGRLKAEFPEVYEAVSEEKTYKIFKVKERKQK
ncbi:MAG: hypothetical protein ACI4TH_09620, partial [Candidatus Ornithomonoglobus sp.]